jgi:hypothetical protein
MKLSLQRRQNQMNRVSRSFKASCQVFLALIMLCTLSVAESKTNPLPAEVAAAKSIYLIDKTGNQAVLDKANYEFNKWGRFAIVQSKEQADLVSPFTHTNGMGKWGNIGIIKMDVFLKENTEPSFHSESNEVFITKPQLRTTNCVLYFRDRLEPKK